MEYPKKALVWNIILQILSIHLQNSVLNFEVPNISQKSKQEGDTIWSVLIGYAQL